MIVAQALDIGLSAVPLSDDQKALLRLLAQREQGYEDIGALMGLSVEQVRARVREALAAFDEAGEPVEAAPRAVEPPSPPPPAPATPEVKPPKPPSPPAQPPRAATPARPARPSIPRLPLPGDRRRLFELAGGALVVILLVLFATGLVNIDGGGGSRSSTTANTSPTEATGGKNAKLTQAVLKPVNGGSATGRALFGRVGRNAVLQVVAQGLEPSPSGESYAVWLYRSPKLVLRVGAVKVGRSGGLAARLPIPAELLAYVAAGAFKQIDVSLASDAAYGAELARAKREKRLPAYTGTDILRGDITGPIVKK
jgi:hypothetical protein